MRRGSAVLLVLTLAVAGCGGPSDAPESAAAAPSGNTNAPIAGRTLKCQTGGPVSDLTFAADGTLRGRLLDSEVTGTWEVTESREIHAHVKSGAISLRDNLRPIANGWAGKTLRCTG